MATTGKEFGTKLFTPPLNVDQTEIDAMLMIPVELLFDQYLRLLLLILFIVLMYSIQLK